MGTLAVILMGEGVDAVVTLKQSKAETAGWMVNAAGWDFAVFCGFVPAIVCGSPGAHLLLSSTPSWGGAAGLFLD